MSDMKRCPQCGTVSPMLAAVCPQCQRVFKTTAPNLSQTTVIPSPPQQPPSQQPIIINVNQPSGQTSGSIVSPTSNSQQVWAIVCSVAVGWWLGAMLNQQIAKGAVILGTIILLSIITWGLVLPVYWVLGIVDTVMVANRHKRGEPVKAWQFF